MRRLLLLLILLVLSACGGGGGSHTEVAKTSCQTGFPLKDLPVGYDILFNFENRNVPEATFTLDEGSHGEDCERLLSKEEIFPWVRVDTDVNSSSNGSSLVFQLVEPGGRNAPVLLSKPVPDPNSDSVGGPFSYTFSVEQYADTGLVATLNCSVQYDGMYCPFAVSDLQTGERTPSFFMNADGAVHCRFDRVDGRPNTECNGRIAAHSAILEARSYGE